MNRLRMRRQTTFTTNATVLIGGLGAVQLVSAVTFILAARFLGPGDYGRAAALYGVAVFAATLLDFGAATQGIRTLAGAGERSKFERVAPSRVWLTIAFMVLGACAFVAGLSPIVCLVPVVAAGIAFEQFACAPSRARERFAWVSAVQIADKVWALGIFCVLQVGHLTDGDVALMIALATGPIIGSALALADWGSLRTSLLRLPRTSPWRGSGHLGVAGLAVGSLSLDVQLMGWSAGHSVAGAYAAVSKFGAPATLWVSGVSQASFPAMIGANTIREAQSTLRSARRALLAPILLLVLLGASAGVLVPLLLGDAYASSVPTLRVFSVALIFVCLTQPVVTFLQARGQERVVGGILTLGAVVQLVSVVVFAQLWGAVGGAAAALLAQLVMGALIWRTVRRFTSRKESVHA